MFSVFALEWLNACRRGRHHRFRGVYTAVLAAEAAFFLVFWALRAAGWIPATAGSEREALGQLAVNFLRLLLVQHFSLLVLATPALAAGTITDEKTRGTLGLLLTTSLTSAEIVLGKWLAQTAQALVLAMPAVPLIVVLSVLVGVPELVIAWALETTLLAMVVAAAATLVSVYSRRTARAVISVYVAAGLVAGAGVLGLIPWPILTLEPGSGAGGGSAISTVAAVVIAVSLALGMLSLAVLRLRNVFARQEGETRSWFARVERAASLPPVSENPLRWKERYAGELGALSFWRRLPRWLRLGGTAVGLLLLLIACLSPVWPWSVTGLNTPQLTLIFVGLNLAYLFLIGFVGGARSSGVVTAERERRSWDLLLSTPLTSRQLVRGKLWGVMDSARPYLVFSLVPLGMLSAAAGLWCFATTACFWVLTWGFLYFQCANGVYWSCRSESSWQSLARASASGYGAVLLRAFLAGVPAGALVSSFLIVPSLLLAAGLGGAEAFPIFALAVGFATPVVLALFSRAEELLEMAEKHLAETERAES